MEGIEVADVLELEGHERQMERGMRNWTRGVRERMRERVGQREQGMKKWTRGMRERVGHEDVREQMRDREGHEDADVSELMCVCVIAGGGRVVGG